MKRLAWNIWSKNPKDFCGQILHDSLMDSWVINDAGNCYNVFRNTEFSLSFSDINGLIQFLNLHDIQPK